MLWAQFDALEMGTGWGGYRHPQAADYDRERIRRFPPGQLSSEPDGRAGGLRRISVRRQAGQVLRYRHLRRLRAGSRRHERRSGVPRSHRQHGRGSRLRRALGRHDPLVELRQVHPGAPQGRSPHGHSGHLHAGRLHAPRSEYDDLSGRGRHFPAPEAQGCHHSAGGPRLQADRLSVRRRVHLPRNGFHHAVHG